MTSLSRIKKQLPMLSPVMGLLRASWAFLGLLAGLFIATRDFSLRESRSVFPRGAMELLSSRDVLPTE